MQDFFFFFLMVSEQVNLIHKRRPYGKIKKSTKSLPPNAEVPKLLRTFALIFRRIIAFKLVKKPKAPDLFSLTYSK